MNREKILIIKLGWSETLSNDTQRVASLGDVLRSTVLLHVFKNAGITWLVDEKAAPLLKGNPYIKRILRYCPAAVSQLKSERFDTIINLEKAKEICAFAGTLTGLSRFGFRLSAQNGSVAACKGSEQVIDICLSHSGKVANHRYWEEMLFKMVNRKWTGQMPIIGCRPSSEVKFDIGFNHHVGEKWPVKAWPSSCWAELEKMLKRKYSISWQKGLDSIEDYIEWINSCSLLVTNDSLGLHIAHALDKKIVSLFGPTLESEVYVKNGVKLLPGVKRPCMPCLSNQCKQERTCMFDISPAAVCRAVDELYKGERLNYKIPLSPPLEKGGGSIRQEAAQALSPSLEKGVRGI